MDGWMQVRREGGRDRQTDRQADGRMDGWVDGWMDGWMGGWVSGCVEVSYGNGDKVRLWTVQGKGVWSAGWECRGWTCVPIYGVKAFEARREEEGRDGFPAVVFGVRGPAVLPCALPAREAEGGGGGGAPVTRMQTR